MNIQNFISNHTPRSIDLFLIWKGAYRALRIETKNGWDHVTYETILKIAEEAAIKLGINKILGQRVAHALAVSLFTLPTTNIGFTTEVGSRAYQKYIANCERDEDAWFIDEKE